MSPTFKEWIRTPTTIHGVGALLGVAAGVVCYYATRDVDTAAVVAGSMFGVVCMAMGDNSGDKSSVEKLVADAIQAIVSQKVAAAIPTLGADLVHVFQSKTVSPLAPGASVTVSVPPSAPVSVPATVSISPVVTSAPTT